ncbi:hypothetical protein 1 [Wenzhou shrimp virus 5]|uniref:hypothetical protein 1 n=1 Tax=Wenzhou shrimp virus 5 TaxID=1923652 RepID=UPI00090CD79C|nr:hypothetical protein 1 [Wenzhou shrimp virus 5]APG78050.1 hypothetical protein 1 [Wenzhou shrimp virus 5]
MQSFTFNTIFAKNQTTKMTTENAMLRYKVRSGQLNTLNLGKIRKMKGRVLKLSNELEKNPITFKETTCIEWTIGKITRRIYLNVRPTLTQILDTTFRYKQVEDLHCFYDTDKTYRPHYPRESWIRGMTPIADAQGIFDGMGDIFFPSIKSASEHVSEVSQTISNTIKEMKEWCKTPEAPTKIASTLLFIVNQIIMIRNNISSTTILQLLLSILMYTGFSFKKAIKSIYQLVNSLFEDSPGDLVTAMADVDESFSLEDEDTEAENQMGLDALTPFLKTLSDNTDLVCGAIVTMITSVCALPFVPTNIKSIVGAVKDAGLMARGLTSISAWVKTIITAIQEVYYKSIHGCTKSEYDLMQLVPQFHNLMKDTYTLLSVPVDKFNNSKELCEIVKGMYMEFQGINQQIVRHGGALSAEMKYAFSKLERQFLPLYEQVKLSPLFNNVSRAKPLATWIYGKPGVGKSNLVNMMAALCAKKLYPKKTFNGENSVMWSRRVENEYHDGYAHQPFVQFDDCLQIIDTSVKPNPELMEIIYMVNDAPYQLHMSDIKEKKTTYFDSDHLVASSNQKIPTAVSIHDVGAFRRRFTFAIEVKVAPQYGKPHMDKDQNPYFMVDETKVASALDTQIYQIHHYDLNTGKPILINGMPKVQTFDQFIDEYTATFNMMKDRRKDQRQAIYATLGTEIKEDNDLEIVGHYADTHSGAIMEETTATDPDIDIVTKTVHPNDIPAEIPTTVQEIDLSDRIVLTLQKLDQETTKDLNDEEDVDHFEEVPLGESKLVNDTREVFKKKIGKMPGLFSRAWERMKSMYDKIKGIFKITGKKLLIMAGALATLVATVFLFKPRECALKGEVVDNFNFFARVCGSGCENCEYIKSTLGSSINFGLGQEAKIQLATWNLRAAEIMARKDTNWAKCVQYWTNFLNDCNDTMQLAEVATAQSRRLTSRRRSAARPEAYGRTASYSARPEAYGRTSSAPAIAEAYGRAGEVVAEVQAGACFDYQSISAASEQYVRILFRNSASMIADGMRVGVLFLTGRTMLCNHHAWAAAERRGQFQLRNPGAIESTTIKIKECRYERVNRGGEYDQDLMMVELPVHVPMRPDIMSKIVKGAHQGGLEERSATLVGFNRISGLETLSEKPINDLSVTDIKTKSQDGQVHTIRKGYAYTAVTRAGDCGSLLFTNSTLAEGKLIGFHSAGIPKDGVGFSEALERGTLEATMSKLQVKKCTAVVGETQGMKKLASWHDLGDVIHHGDSEFVPQQPTHHEHKPSILSNVLAEPKAKLAHLKPVKVGDDIIDPLKKGLAKVANTPGRLDEKLLDLAVTDVKRTLNNTMDEPHYGVISYEEAITGVEGDAYISPVKRSTAPGEPWKSMKKTTLPGKKEWLNVIVDGQATDEYRVDEPTLKAAVEHRINEARKGVRVPALYTATLKDERRPAEKVDAIKTRVFAAAPQDYVLAVRMYFADFVAAIMDARIHDEVAVGIDHRKEWPTLANYLLGYGDNFIAGDFSNFDGSLLSEVMWKICEIVNEWYGDSEENQLIREILFEDIASAYVNCRGHVVQWTHSQPSGNPLTVIVNSVFQMIMFRYVYLWLKAEQGLPIVCDFRKNVRMVTYGDDGMLSVRERIVEWFNQETITQAFAKCGLTYTDEAKTGKVYKTRPLSEISFLKRSFAQVDGIWMGALDRDVIYEMCLWTRPKYETLQCQENCAEALKEAVAHGEEFYETFADQLDQAIYRTGNKLDVPIYTFGEMIEELYASYY